MYGWVMLVFSCTLSFGSNFLHENEIFLPGNAGYISTAVALNQVKIGTTMVVSQTHLSRRLYGYCVWVYKLAMGLCVWWLHKLAISQGHGNLGSPCATVLEYACTSAARRHVHEIAAKRGRPISGEDPVTPGLAWALAPRGQALAVPSCHRQEGRDDGLRSVLVTFAASPPSSPAKTAMTS